MIVGLKELISVLCFFKDKIRINMVIPIFKGSKGEGLEVFLKEYKRACIGTWLKTITEWLNFLPEFLEGTTDGKIEGIMD